MSEFRHPVSEETVEECGNRLVKTYDGDRKMAQGVAKDILSYSNYSKEFWKEVIVFLEEPK